MFVKLKWGMEYKGFLVSTDNYMNLQVRICGHIDDVNPGIDMESTARRLLPGERPRGRTAVIFERIRVPDLFLWPPVSF